jgi:copper homeostasis protein
MNKQIEIACFDIESAIIASKAGADRIELCDQLSLGGTTPSWQSLIDAKEKINTDIFVMIRPRGGDFCYDEEEFEQMKNDIVSFKKLGVLGFVFGILTRDGQIDIERNRDLIHFAYPFHCTFHRAFDRTIDIFESLEVLIKLGFQNVLTSGGESDVKKGFKNLKQLVIQANNRICVMPGGGVRSSNIKDLSNYTNAVYFHSSAIIDESLLADADEIKLLKSLL